MKKALRLTIIFLSVLLAALLCIAVWLNADTQFDPQNSVHTDPSDIPLEGWQELDGNKYYYRSGTPQTGWAVLPEGKFYFGQDGVMTVGFLELEGKRYCFAPDGVMYTGWQELDGGRYYFDENGVQHTEAGWLTLGADTWYLKEDGQPYTGWLETEKARYYFLEDGKMAVGAHHIDGIDRYFTSDGNYIPLVNPWNSMPEDFTPNLVEVADAEVDSTCVDALLEMIQAAADDGLICGMESSYRNMATQQYIWDKWYNDFLNEGNSQEEAYRLTARRVAVPGTSEHHTGLAIDVSGSDGIYQWCGENSWKYGFHVRYRGDKEALTGIQNEPWHLRYVGKELAQLLYEKDWCLEEFLASVQPEN